MSELEDKLSIIELTSSYATAIDSKDWDLYASLFTSDAVIDYTSSGGIRGTKEEALAFLTKALEPFTMTQHLVTNHLVVLEGDSATCRCDFYNPMGRPDGRGGLVLFFVGGAYRDKLHRTPEGWKFTERVEKMLWLSGDVPKGLELASEQTSDASRAPPTPRRPRS